MFEIILDKTIVIDLMKLSDEGRILQRILFNDKNIFIISKSLLEYFEEHLVQEDFVKWQDLFKFLNDKNQLKSIKGQDTLLVEDIYNSIEKSRNYIIILKNDLTLISQKYICCLKDSSTCNKLLKKLLENNEITFRYTDFSTNDELFSFFNQMFSCSKTAERVILISRYSNFDCKLIQLLKSKFDEKSYWTTYKTQNNCPSNNMSYLREKLGNKLLVFTGSNDNIHERKIIIDSLLFEFDDDFNKIDIVENTWKCTCIVDSSVTTELRRKQTLLKRIR